MSTLTLLVEVEEGHVEREKPCTHNSILPRVIFGELLATNYVKSLQHLLLQCKFPI